MTSTVTHLSLAPAKSTRGIVAEPSALRAERHDNAMNEADRSPRRRHILSSINPEAGDDPEPRRKRRRHSRSRDDEHKERRDRSRERDDHERRRERRRRREEREARDAERHEDDRTKPRRSRLKLKHGHSSSRRRYRSRSPRQHDGADSVHTTGSRHRKPDEETARSPTPPNPYSFDPLDPDVAFRESVFDAMADAEGAEYWEGVYGQPIHNYAPPDGQGELERMTEDEYAAYVRQKMWEKTHAGVLEERAKREERKKQKEAEDRRKRRLEREMEESLRRGEERRARRAVKERWQAYADGWAGWDGKPESIPWPGTEKGADVDEKTVRAFFVQGLQLEELGEKAFTAKLRDERVRWHPDKIQQRAGGTVDEATMRNVTAVFQIIDRLWGEMRAQAAPRSMTA